MKLLIVAFAICLISATAALAWTHGLGVGPLGYLLDNSSGFLLNGTSKLLAQ